MTGQLGLFDLEPKPDKPQIDPVQELDVIALDKDQTRAKLPDLVPPSAVLEVNKHYETREIHVGRVLGLLQEKHKKGDTINRDEIGYQLSMTKALTEGTTNVMRRLEFIDNSTRITPWGSLVFRNSPYLDNPGLLWLLHYFLGSNANLVLWSSLFNFILFEQEVTSIKSIAEFFQPLHGRWSEKSINVKVPQELNGIFKTYTQAMFHRLALIQKIDKASYIGFWDTAIIPGYVWFSSILVYRDRYYSGASSLEIPLIARAHYSPGRILRQNEASVRQALDTLHNAGLLTVETRSGLDQVRFKREHTWLSAAARHLRGEIVA